MLIKMIRTFLTLLSIGFFAIAFRKLLELLSNGLKTSSINYDTPFFTFTTHQRFLDILISMLAKLAKVDGRITTAEIERMERVIHEQLGLTGRKATRAKKIFNKAKESSVSFEQLAEDFKFLCYHKPYLRYTMLETLCSLAASDGDISQAEEKLLWTAGRTFGFSQSRYEQIRDVYSKQKRSSQGWKQPKPEATKNLDPFDVLGLKRGASEAEIKKSYRKLVKETHPDTAIAQDLPEIVVESYERRFQEVQEAYDKIREIKGF